MHIASSVDDDDDDDSLYSNPPALAPRASPRARDTVLHPNDSQPLDDALDREDAAYLRRNPPPGELDSDGHVSDSDEDGAAAVSSEDELYNDYHKHIRHDYPTVVEELPDEPLPRFPSPPLHALDDDDWFDPDENKVEVESLASSDSSGLAPDRLNVPPGPSTRPTPADARHATPLSRTPHRASTATSSVKKSGTASSSGLSLLTRASQTFYKAFKKGPKKAPSVQPPVPNNAADERDKAAAVAASEREAELMHARVEQLLEAQIATLNGAKTGFVDVRLLQPMTEQTLKAVEGDAARLLADFGDVQRRAGRIEADAVRTEHEAEVELEAKEQMLIAAKVRLAEAAAEVDGLRHELKRLQRELGRPERVEMRRRVEQRRKRERLREEAVALGEARAAAEQRVVERRQSLGRERAGLDRLESGFKDIEGDWA